MSPYPIKVRGSHNEIRKKVDVNRARTVPINTQDSFTCSNFASAIVL
jgi:hypothetical protein